jgi:hypothetical protein
LLLCGCELGLWVDVTLMEDHPWEAESGRRFWYTILFLGSQGVEQRQISIGVRSFRIAIPTASTCVVAAYPLGKGIPFGGAYQRGNENNMVELHMSDGPLADALLQIARSWPKPVSRLNFAKLSHELEILGGNSMAIDWNRMARDIVNGGLDDGSLKTSATRQVMLSDVVEGRWTAETEAIRSFHAFMGIESNLGFLPPGVFRYVNLSAKMELRVVVPEGEDEEVFWHMVPLETLLRISEPAYQDLLERVNTFP